MTAPGRQWVAGAVAAACVVAAIITSAQLYVPLQIKGDAARFWVLLSVELAEWALWGLVTPLIWWIDSRWGFRVRPRARAFATHFSVALLWFLVHNAIVTAIGLTVPESGYAELGFVGAFAFRFGVRLPTALTVYTVIVGAGYAAWWAAAYHRREAERAQLEAQQAQLEAQLATARLHALRMQLHPHFLFNTLHTIAGHVREGERDTAVDLISRLSDLLRRSLHDADRHEVSLADEIQFVESYLELERARFGDSLVTRLDIAPDAREALVPSLLLQPLVENAIRHGVARREGTRELRIAAYPVDGRLRLEVVDNGPGYEPTADTNGVGLRNTRERLSHLYGKRHDLQIVRRPEGGTAVCVEIPLRSEASDGS